MVDSRCIPLLLALSTQSSSSPPQSIGAIPAKGNNWRFKYPDEIRVNVSSSFRSFIQSEECRRSYSDESGITLYYNSMGKKYPQLQIDDNVCEFPLSKLNPFDEERNHIYIYYLCDDTCCNMECCQRDWPISILGFSFITLALLILLIYFIITTSSFVFRWRRKNGWCSNLPIRSQVTKDGTALTLLSSHHVGDRV
ncbi:hypothetical protein PENTCL1PPCAC_2341 [Pristionchus entomophagus]|uniref:CX domain-containing protein n=1 Tax=Pristionchus entomophagus TaxID=358040 RepID=A0AAV5SKI4_9BILA|nr:hypothetical protein PENTCL1PPCAC_2341 [Pristionchus entomophagus]